MALNFMAGLLLVIAAPSAHGTSQGPDLPKSTTAEANAGFTVATIKPSAPNRPGWTVGTKGTHFFTLGANMNDLITFAYGIHAKQIVGGPKWFLTDKFDIEAVPDIEGKPNRDQLKAMVQSLLANRFKLVVHHDQRELAVYVLAIANGTPTLTKSKSPPNVYSGYDFPRVGVGATMKVMNMSLSAFANAMQRTVLDKPVVDKTGLTDRYDFSLNWTPDDSQFIQLRETGVSTPSASEGPNAPPGLYTAIKEQLGLKLEPMKELADVIVIDHVEQPSPN